MHHLTLPLLLLALIHPVVSQSKGLALNSCPGPNDYKIKTQGCDIRKYETYRGCIPPASKALDICLGQNPNWKKGIVTGQGAAPDPSHATANIPKVSFFLPVSLSSSRLISLGGGGRLCGFKFKGREADWGLAIFLWGLELLSGDRIVDEEVQVEDTELEVKSEQGDSNKRDWVAEVILGSERVFVGDIQMRRSLTSSTPEIYDHLSIFLQNE